MVLIVQVIKFLILNELNFYDTPLILIFPIGIIIISESVPKNLVELPKINLSHDI